MDAVEIILRTEEFFSISIDDAEAATVNTVGDLYRMVCTKLDVLPLADPITSRELPQLSKKEKARFIGYYVTSMPAAAEMLPFNAQRVWDCVVTIFVDQMLMEPDEVHYSARIAQDLGID